MLCMLDKSRGYITSYTITIEAITANCELINFTKKIDCESKITREINIFINFSNFTKMKHLKEKDLSLDKQVVSDLTGGSDTKDETNNELICGSKVCTDSNFEICCAISEEDTCPEKCPVVKTVDVCIATRDTLCDHCSDVPDCLTPIPETKGCLD